MPCVDHGTNTDGRITFTNLEYIYDPDPTDTTIECLSWYIIREDANLRVEQDRHIMGLFSINTWMVLMDQAGFDVEEVPYDVHEDHREAYLLVGVSRGSS